MKSDNAIKVNNVSKTFRVPHRKIDSMRSAFVNLFAKNSIEEFTALDDISFEVKKGEFLGIIGRNGSGKSTLLKILAGVYETDKGSVEVNGRISPFLELGIGFNPELSGRDNIYLNATVLGMSKKKIDQKFDEIVAFSEIGRFIDQQVKNYSSGMRAKLAFAITIFANRDILLMDEVLAVGDNVFQEKCLKIFKEHKKENRTIILVTHSMATVREHCDRAILLSDSKIIAQGDVDKVCDAYVLNNMSTAQRQKLKDKDESKRRESVRMKKLELKQNNIREKQVKKIAKITDLKFYDQKSRKIKKITWKDDFQVEATVDVTDIDEEMIIAIQIFDKANDYFICGNNTQIDRFDCKWRVGLNTIVIQFKDVMLNMGDIYSKVILTDKEMKNRIDIFSSKEKESGSISVCKQPGAGNGIMRIDHQWAKK